MNGLAFYNDMQAQIDFGFPRAHVTGLGPGKADHRVLPTRRRPARRTSWDVPRAASRRCRKRSAPLGFCGIIAVRRPDVFGPLMYLRMGGRALVGKVSRADLELVMRSGRQVRSG